MNRIPQLLQMLDESPKDSFLIHALSLEYIKAGDDETARQYFEKNLENDPDYVATYYHLGKLLEREGNEAAAIEVFGRGMEVAKRLGDQHAYSELRSVWEELSF